METGRREFIRKSMYGVLALLGLGFLAPTFTLLTPVAFRNKELILVPLCPEEEIPRRGVKKAEAIYTSSGREHKARVFIVSSARGFSVVSAVCSHLGCLVNYNRERNEFLCPCHGGRYDLSGKNIAGPPPAPLRVLPSRIEKGMLLVGMKV